MTTCITCSTPPTTLTPHSGSRLIRAARASASPVVRPETTSSSRINFGLVARARAISRRFRAASGNPRAWKSFNGDICRKSRIFAACSSAWRTLLVCIKAPSITFCSTDRLGRGLDLKCPANTKPGRVVWCHATDNMSVEDDGAFIGMKKAADEVEDSSFACAVRPNDKKNLAFAHGEGHFLHGSQSAEPLGNIIELKDGSHLSAT